MINIKKLYPDSQLPTIASQGSAGYDLYTYCCKNHEPDSNGKIRIDPHQTAMIDTGIALEVPKGYFGGIFPRSGISSKKGLRPANCVGVVDSDYRGTVYVALHNDTNEIQYIEKGERIAQLIFIPYTVDDFNIVDDLESTNRGEGGFGSTGK